MINKKIAIVLLAFATSANASQHTSLETIQKTLSTLDTSSIQSTVHALISQPSRNKENVQFKETNFPDNFSASKRYLKKLARVQGFGETFYDDCKITFHGAKKTTLKPDLSTCNYRIRNFKNKARANRIEYEHIVPISWIGKQMRCWDDGGRKNCGKVSDAFNHAEANLVNLQPSVGEINGDRSYYRYADRIDGWDYGSQGKVVFSLKEKRLQPPEEKKGWIGRVHLYMKDTYGLKMSKSYEQMIKAWATKPATKLECRYNDRLQKDFGSSNPYTTAMCKHN